MKRQKTISRQSEISIKSIFIPLLDCPLTLIHKNTPMGLYIPVCMYVCMYVWVVVVEE